MHPPIMNMDLNLKDAEDFKFSPDKSVTLLLPSLLEIFCRRAVQS